MHSLLSSAQESLYQAYLLYGKAYPMNIGGVLDLSFVMSSEKLETKIRQVVNSVQVLHTRFALKDNTIGQYVDDTRDYVITYFDDTASIQTLVDKPFDLFGRLFRIGILKENQGLRVVFIVHHMILDGHSLIQLAEMVNDAVCEKPIPSGLPFLEYIEAEQRYFKSSRYEADRAYFEEEVKHIAPVSVKPMQVIPDLDSTFRIDYTCNQDENMTISAFLSNHDISTQVMFESLLALDLAHIHGTSRVTLGITLRNRLKHSMHLMGMCTATLPMTLQLNEDESFEAFLKSIHKKHFELYRHRSMPYHDVLRLHHMHSKAKPFDAMVITHPLKNMPVRFLYESKCDLGLLVSIQEKEGQFAFIFQFKASAFTKASAHALITRWKNRLDKAIKNPKMSLKDVMRIEDPYGIKEVPVLHTSVLDRFSDMTHRHKKNVALIDSHASLTYEELNHLSDQISTKMCALGVNKSYVRIHVTTKIHAVASMLGVIKSNNAYVFFPEGLSQVIDIAYTLEDAFFEELPSEVTRVKRDFEVFALYVSSGTTTAPKVIQMSESGLLNYVFQESNYQLQASKVSTFLNVAMFHFDISLEMILLSILNGKTLILSDIQSLARQSVSADFISLTPTHMAYLLQYPAFMHTLASFKCIVFGGEVLSAALVKEVRQHTTATLYNSYGPTEASIAVTSTKIKDAIHIGKPLSNVDIKIVNPQCEVIPLGYVGQLIIGKRALALGYLSSNQEGFKVIAGVRYYLTGDYGWMDEENNIHFVTRKDRQVKLRGLRIELSAIEDALYHIPNVHYARAELQDGKLIAYVASPNEVSALYEALKEKLPLSFLPNQIIKQDDVVFNSSGKRVIKRTTISPLTPWVPKTRLEKQIARLVKEVLEIDEIHCSHSLLDYGMDSLQLLTLALHFEAMGFLFDLTAHYEQIEISKLASKLKRLSHQSTKEAHHVFLNRDMHKPCNPHYVLFGATGFLGMHVLHELLSKTSATISVLVRRQLNVNVFDYVDKQYDYYFNQPLPSKRVSILEINYLDPTLGLSEKAFDRIFETHAVMVNFAANINYLGAREDFEGINVTFPQHLIKIAQDKRIPFFHTSTLGLGLSEHCLFDETSPYKRIRYNTHYLTTKRSAEEHVLKAMKEGAPIQLVRVGNLMPRRTDLRFIRDPLSNAMVKLLTQASANEQVEDIVFDFSPVDEVARAYVALITSQNDLPIAHVYHPSVFKRSDFFDSLSKKKAFNIASELTIRHLRDAGFAYSPLDRNYVLSCIKAFHVEKK